MTVPALSVAAALMLAATATVAQAATPTPEAEACRALGAEPLGDLVGEPDLKIVTARFNPAFGLTEATEIPANCELIGTVRSRTGVDGQAYTIRFHLRLPAQWNGRFFFQGGGGSNGSLGDALGNLQGRQPLPALSLGYAVLSQDSGHDNTTNNVNARQGVLSFGHDPQARLDYAYASQALTTRIAKAIVQRHYGQPARYSYFVGCSKGGQEGMAMTQRYPDLFDGVLAGAPGLRLPRAALAQAFDVQTLGALARVARQVDPSGRPDLYRAFNDEDLALVSFAVLTACDGLDGADDGWIGATSACTTARVTPELAKVTCAEDKRQGCLTADQVKALLTVQAGGKDGKGKPIYASWPWHAGFGGEGASGWRLWKLGTGSGYEPGARNVTLGAGSLSGVFTTPPRDVADMPETYLDYQLGFDFDRDAAGLYATDGDFKVSAWDAMSADSTDRRAFRQRGGKLIIFHGTADPVFSLNDTVDWYQGLDATEGGKAAAYVRLYPVPGMAHCVGNLALDRFDAFGALVAWVETGKPPDALPAGPGRDSPWQGRSRPLCAWPLEARYRGVGDVDKAESFTCQKPG